MTYLTITPSCHHGDAITKATALRSWSLFSAVRAGEATDVTKRVKTWSGVKGRRQLLYIKTPCRISRNNALVYQSQKYGITTPVDEINSKTLQSSQGEGRHLTRYYTKSIHRF